MVAIQMIHSLASATDDYFKKALVRANGVVENFELGWEKATFTALEGEDLMNPDFLSEEINHSWFEYPMVKHPCIQQKV